MKRTKLPLTPAQKRALHLSTALLWLSGVAWLCLSESQASRPLWMKIHGAAAMAFLVVLGTLAADHIPIGWKQGEQRPAGGTLLALCALLAVSGWGLYYLGNETLRHWTSAFHSIAGLLLPAVIFLHVRLANRNPKN